MRSPLFPLTGADLRGRERERGETKAHRRGSTAYAHTRTHTRIASHRPGCWPVLDQFRLGRCFYSLSLSSSTHLCVCVRGPVSRQQRIWSVCGAVCSRPRQVLTASLLPTLSFLFLSDAQFWKEMDAVLRSLMVIVSIVSLLTSDGFPPPRIPISKARQV